MTVIVVANGELADPEFLAAYLTGATAVVAADGGGRHLQAVGRRPDVLVGDLDSLEVATADEMARAGTRLIKADRDKDETDLELALLYVTRQAQWKGLPVLVFGVLGGRLDQTLANILLLAHPALKGRDIRLMEPNQQAWLIDGRARIDGQIGDRLSLIPLGGPAMVVRTKGLRWPLIEETLPFGPARGVSNELIAPHAEVTVSRGHLLCIHLRKGWDR